MGKNRRVIILLGTTVLLAGLVWLAFSVHESSLSELQKRGVIRVGYAVEAPYAFIGADGVVTGESPEVAKVIINQLGIPQVEWVQVEFRNLLDSLNQGRIDVVAAGVFITPERSKLVSFSHPTFRVREGMLVTSGNPRKIHSYKDAAHHPDIKVAVLAGSVEEELLRIAGFSDQQFLRVSDSRTGLDAVNSGVADGLALSAPTVHWMAMKQTLGHVESAEPFVLSGLDAELGYGAFAFRKTDGQLLKAWNRCLKAFVGTQEHRKLVGQFGFKDADIPNQEVIMQGIGNEK